MLWNHLNFILRWMKTPLCFAVFFELVLESYSRCEPKIIKAENRRLVLCVILYGKFAWFLPATIKFHIKSLLESWRARMHYANIWSKLFLEISNPHKMFEEYARFRNQTQGDGVCVIAPIAFVSACQLIPLAFCGIILWKFFRNQALQLSTELIWYTYSGFRPITQ